MEILIDALNLNSSYALCDPDYEDQDDSSEDQCGSSNCPLVGDYGVCYDD